MNTTLTFSPEEIAPAPETVYGLQGLPPAAPVPERVDALYAGALHCFRATAEARGIVEPITRNEFATVYEGEGRNEPNTPVGDIIPQADCLALFAVTLGAKISTEISERFRTGDFALASMLDSVASAAADRTADLLQGRFADSLEQDLGRTSAKSRQPVDRPCVLRYSPGYCGWHVSGQRKLFEYLRPERIGLSLRTSFLMDPLKSVSGVLVAGPRKIHEFPNTYDFCRLCDTRGCRERIQSLHRSERALKR